jgi:MFS family permease
VSFAALLPLSFVMIAGPQIISAFFFATSENWKRESAAYVLGAALSVTAVVTIAYLVAGGVGRSDEDSGLSTLDYVVLGLLVVAMVEVFRGRKDTEPPKWMGKLQSATPKVAFVLGFLLLGFFPSDLVTSIGVGTRVADQGEPWWHACAFVFFTMILLALPALVVVALGDRAQSILPKVRDWISTNSWIVSEVVLVFFIAIVLSG